MAVSIGALFLTYLAVGLLARADWGNIVGAITFYGVFLALALWVDWRSIQTWRRILQASRGEDREPG